MSNPPKIPAPATTDTETGEASAASSCSAIPAYFAGVFCTEENVSGGTGQTVEDAIVDYFANHADDEIDYYTDINAESGTIEVEVFEVYKPEPDDEDNSGDWTWMCGKRVERRGYKWHIEPDAEGTGVPGIVYSPNK